MTGRRRLVRSTGILADQKADREALVSIIRAAWMQPYDDGKGGTLWRAASAEEITDTILDSDWLAALIEREHSKAVAPIHAVLKRLEKLNIDHRHEAEPGAASPFGVDGRAYYYAGDIVDFIYELRAACDPAAATTHDRAVAAQTLRDAADAARHRKGIPNPDADEIDAWAAWLDDRADTLDQQENNQ